MNFEDGNILFSFINTKLRDEFDSLDSLCEELGLPREEAEERLRELGYTYDETLNRFV